ncbi:MAG: enoyl-ACP reductase [Chloroflexi bacterium]|nr:enoyl-ACP reductase [Chloroflexota bacterium]MYD37616.1 enoyl-ACP reductase [Chloroflexota bacterium]MYI42114.1 enoyl-ACP reductase [Chloroflexota bacterium]
MGLLDGKVALVFGVANKNSIGWGIARALHREGATIALSYAMDRLARRVKPLGESLGCELMLQADVGNAEELDAVFAAVADRYGKLDVLVHSVAFAERDALGGRFVDLRRDALLSAIDISAVSLIELTRRAEPLMREGGSIMSLTYNASRKVIPNYNAMAIAKAALEAITMYLAADVGGSKIRVNAISAGAIKTLSAGGIAGFRDLLKYAEVTSPMNELVSQDDVGDLALFLASDLSRRITGEVIYVDAGYNIMGYTDVQTLMKADT